MYKLLSVFIPARLGDEIVFGEMYPLGKERVDFGSEQEDERGQVEVQQENRCERHLPEIAPQEM